METQEAGYFRAMYDIAITYYRTLYKIAVAINSSLDPETVLKSIVESTAETLNAKGCSVMLLSPDRTQLLHSAAHGLSDNYLRKGPVRVDQSMRDTLNGRSLSIVNAATDPRVQYKAQAVQENIASMLSVPIRLRGEVIGLMRIYTSVPREFTEEEMGFVEAVANLGAIALENARRYDEAKHNDSGSGTASPA